MSEFQISLDRRGRIILPAKLRRQYGIEIGEEVAMRVIGGVLEMTTNKLAEEGVQFMISKTTANDRLKLAISRNRSTTWALQKSPVDTNGF